MGREVSRRRRRGNSPGWGATAMPHLRRNVVELLARVPQEVRTPQEKAGLPAFAHAKDVAPATTGLILYEPPLPERSPLLPAEEAWEANTAEHRRARATTMCGMMWACTDDGLTVWSVMKLPQSTPPIIMTGILDTTVLRDGEQARPPLTDRNHRKLRQQGRAQRSRCGPRSGAQTSTYRCPAQASQMTPTNGADRHATAGARQSSTERSHPLDRESDTGHHTALPRKQSYMQPPPVYDRHTLLLELLLRPTNKECRHGDRRRRRVHRQQRALAVGSGR